MKRPDPAKYEPKAPSEVVVLKCSDGTIITSGIDAASRHEATLALARMLEDGNAQDFAEEFRLDFKGLAAFLVEHRDVVRVILGSITERVE